MTVNLWLHVADFSRELEKSDGHCNEPGSWNKRDYDESKQFNCFVPHAEISSVDYGMSDRPGSNETAYN